VDVANPRPADHPDLGLLLEALGTYRAARQEFLTALGCEGSNRDPFAEFGEHVALAVVGGEMAVSRVQKGWDFLDTDGRRVQVRYLANPAGAWVNEHLVDFRGNGCDRYALVFFEALDVLGLIVFDREHIADVGAALNKRHPGQDVTLQLTAANYRAIAADPERFAALGAHFTDLSITAVRRELLDVPPDVVEQARAGFGDPNLAN